MTLFFVVSHPFLIDELAYQIQGKGGNYERIYT
jgi:hypothetical protein